MAAAAAHNSEANPNWAQARDTLNRLDELTRRLKTLQEKLGELDAEVEDLSNMLGTLTATLDKARKPVVRQSANKFLRSAETFLQFAENPHEVRTPLQEEQLATSWGRLWGDLREKLDALADRIAELGA